jgi:hypothetical protein
MGRPISFSEGHIRNSDLPTELYETLTVPEQNPEQNPEPKPTPEEFALRFTFHLTLISAFETLFFWQFVAPTEDAVLIGLINGYTGGLCQNISAGQQSIARTVFALLQNQTDAVRFAGAVAAQSRTAYNRGLIQQSWFYFGGLTIVFCLLAVGVRAVNWRTLLVENLVLVTLLGLYEWMFFSTIVLRYQSISMPELNVMILNTVASRC